MANRNIIIGPEWTDVTALLGAVAGDRRIFVPDAALEWFDVAGADAPSDVVEGIFMEAYKPHIVAQRAGEKTWMRHGGQSSDVSVKTAEV